jgi:hypothetical protein
VDYCQKKIIAIFRDMFIIFCGISEQACIYSSISVGTPKYSVEPLQGSGEPCARNTDVVGALVAVRLVQTASAQKK